MKRWEVSPALRIASVTLVTGLLLGGPFSNLAYAAFPGINGKISVGEYGWDTNFDTCTTNTANLGETLFDANFSSPTPISLTDTQGYAVGVGAISWSPDGTHYAFGAPRPDELGIANANGSAYYGSSYYVGLTIGGNEPAPRSVTWSPDGKYVYFAGASGLYKLPIAGSSGEALSLVAEDYYDYFSEVKMAPNGQNIAFTQSDLTQIGLIKPNGTGLTLFPRAAGTFDESPDWSPDSTKIVFASNRAKQGTSQWDQPAQLFVMNANGTGVKQLTNNYGYRYEHPVWSPDGTKILVDRVKFTAPAGSTLVMLNPATGAELSSYSPPCNVAFGATGWQSITPPHTAAAGDLNADGRVDLTDLSMMLSHWHASGSGDLDGNGIVDVYDFSRLMSSWTH